MAANVTQLLNMRQRAVRDHLEPGCWPLVVMKGQPVGWAGVSVGITIGLLPDLDLVVVGTLQLALQRRANFRTYYVAGGFRHCLVGHRVVVCVSRRIRYRTGDCSAKRMPMLLWWRDLAI